MELEARVVQVLPLEKGVTKSGDEWKKATLIVETNGQFPKKVALSNFKRAEEFNAIPVETQCKFRIDVESREWNGKWFTNCNCYAWEVAGETPQPIYAQPQPTQQPPVNVQVQEQDELPF